MNKGNSIWATAEKMLLVVKYSSLDDLKKFREAIKDIGLNVHQCNILAIVDSKKEAQMLTEISSVAYFSEKEINLLGRFKNEKVAKVIGEKYDLLTVIGDSNKKINKVLKRVSTKMAVGVNSNVEFLTINMKSESSSAGQLLNFVKQTLEKIN
jgi:hypothetical protein